MEQVKKKATHFSALPDEILLLICRYLAPHHVLKAFLHYDERMFRFIREYRQRLDLTGSSYADWNFLLASLIENSLQPTSLTLSNAAIPNQISTFLTECEFSIKFHPQTVYHVSLFECNELDFYSMASFLLKFLSLQSLSIVQSEVDQVQMSNNESTSKTFHSIFQSYALLTNLIFTTSDGIILDKQLLPNTSLTRLTISLQDIDDLYILFEGLAPNLHFLHVTLCQPNIYIRSALPQSSSNPLRDFRLTVKERVPFALEQLRSVVMPLGQLEKFNLTVQHWNCNNGQFIEGSELEMLIEQFLPQLRHFECSIHTVGRINMQVDHSPNANAERKETFLDLCNVKRTLANEVPFKMERSVSSFVHCALVVQPIGYIAASQ